MAPRSLPRRAWRRRRVPISIALLAVALVALVASGPWRALGLVASVIAWRFPDAPRISQEALDAALRQGQASGPVLLDVRTAAEFAVSHLRGAVRIDPRRDLVGQLGERPRGPVVVYCAVGYRSAVATRLLQAQGVRDVRNLQGGIFAWANGGRPVFRGDRVVRGVHPYDPLWGTLLRRPLHARTPR